MPRGPRIGARYDNLPAQLQPLFAHLLTDPEPTSLIEEVAMARTLFQDWLDRHGSLQDTDEHKAIWERGMWVRLDQLTRIAERASAQQAKEAVSLAEVQAILEALYKAMLAVVQRHIQDAAAVKQIEAGWQRMQVMPQKRKGETVLVLEEGR